MQSQKSSFLEVVNISPMEVQGDHLHLTVVHKDQGRISYRVQPVLDAYPKPCLLTEEIVCVYICIFAYIRSVLLKWVSQSPPHAACYHIENHLGLHEPDYWRHALSACGCPVSATKLETVYSENLVDVGSSFWLLWMSKIRQNDLPSGSSCSPQLTKQAAEVA